jgi:hypothetical protein
MDIKLLCEEKVIIKIWQYNCDRVVVALEAYTQEQSVKNMFNFV